MVKTLINEEKNIYKFELTDSEVIDYLYKCLVETNHGLKRSDFFKDNNSSEYKAVYIRCDGQEANICINNRLLKKYFGAWILAVNKGDGIWFHRELPHKK